MGSPISCAHPAEPGCLSSPSGCSSHPVQGFPVVQRKSHLLSLSWGKAQSLVTSPSPGKSPSSLGARLLWPCTPRGAAGVGQSKEGKPCNCCDAEREPIPIHLCMQQVKILLRRMPLSLPDAGYFKPGEWEMLATEAQSLCLLPRDSGGDGAGARGTRVTLSLRLPSLGKGFGSSW